MICEDCYFGDDLFSGSFSAPPSARTIYSHLNYCPLHSTAKPVKCVADHWSHTNSFSKSSDEEEEAEAKNEQTTELYSIELGLYYTAFVLGQDDDGWCDAKKEVEQNWKWFSGDSPLLLRRGAFFEFLKIFSATFV